MQSKDWYIQAWVRRGAYGIDVTNDHPFFEDGIDGDRGVRGVDIG